ncbi:YDG domain-containing protein [Steroidobacter cummioxidans]|uniref:YDG domain-containing protein n=1 Tax=Steroidobacter cummioxidans TaxID=1803913 RepID=UPI000E312BBC|nr:YDG domain-containing protein [Steroidobacter cummioxidans]
MWKHGNSNRAYRLIWSARHEAFVPAPETTRSRKRSARTNVLREVMHDTTEPRAACAPLLLLAFHFAVALGGVTISLDAGAVDSGALPANATVTAGNVSFSTQGAHLTVNQQTDRAIINWQSFDIGQDAGVRFVQPDVSSVALNRVVGGKASEILGRLDANGQVYLVNPAGVLFGKSAQVNVGGLVASAMRITDEDFLAGRDRFTLDGATGSVVNEGSITAADGGRIVLLGANVSNSGTLAADGGNIALAAGRQVTFTAGANGHLQFAVDATDVATLVANGGMIRADGGQILLTAQGANALAAAVVSNTGTLQARTIAEKEGQILLLADLHEGGTTNVAGTLDASAPVTGDGGFIETSGTTVKIADGTSITTRAHAGSTGTWLVDPIDFTISAGSGAQTSSGIGADTLSANLQNTSVTLATDNSAGFEAGDIHVDAAVNWSADTTLTLNAYRNININAAITATGSNAGLVLNYGNYASSGSVTSGTDYIVNAPITLAGSNASLSINGNAYTLIRSMADLLAINTNLAGRYALVQDLDASGSTYVVTPIANSSVFQGTFAGLGHTLSNLTLSTTGQNPTGLFGMTGASALIRDFGLLGGSVRSTARRIAGPLVGQNSGTVSRCYATTDVLDSGWLGGGGLVGYNGGTVRQSYATGSVNGSTSAGGLVGANGGNVSQSYATGSVSGADAGGLAGYNDGTIGDSYATGSVSGSNSSGGLVGTNYYAGVGYIGAISQSYATGSVNGGNAGGLVGSLTGGAVSDSYWDSASTGRGNAVGTTGSGTLSNVTAIDASNRYRIASYTSFGSWHEIRSASGVWVAYDAGLPQWVMIEGATRPFLYSEWSSTITNIHQLQLMALNSGATYTLARDIDASATSGDNASDMWSTGGFSPIGNGSVAFTGSLQGNGRVIDGLTIDRTSLNHVGLFGYVGSGAAIRDVRLTGASIQGHEAVGALVGYNFRGVVSNVDVNGGSVTGGASVGGLIGVNAEGMVSNSRAGATVIGPDRTGGLVGSNFGNVSQSHATGNVTGNVGVGGLIGYQGAGVVSQSHAAGEVSGILQVGGLVGFHAGTMTESYATGAVSGTTATGGLAGSTSANSTISGSYATGAVTGDTSLIGGLVGENYGTLSQSYATGTVHGAAQIGGLVGRNFGTLSESYATGAVSGVEYVGGLVGFNRGSVGNSFWLSSNTSIGIGESVGGVVDGFTRGLSAAEATSLSTYLDAGWNIANHGGTSSVWRIYDGNTMPLLRSFLTAVTVTAGTGEAPDKIYDGQLAAGSYGYTTDVPGAVLEGTATYTTTSANAGTYRTSDGNLFFGGLYSGQQGYDISYASDTLTITPRNLTVTITADDKIYDGTSAATIQGTLSGVVAGDAVALSSFGAFDDKNAGVGKTVNVSASLGGADSGNYTLSYNDTTQADIQARAITASITADDKTYDSTMAAVTSGTLGSGVIGGDDVTLSTSGSFSDKNAAAGKTVNVSGTLGGADAGNYILTYDATTQADILARAITADITADDKIYDGTTVAIASGTLNGVIGGDQVTLAASGSFSDKNAATAKTVDVSGALSGADAGNYTLTHNTTTQADIQARAITANITADDKTYDGTAAAVTGGTLAGVVGGDDLSLATSGSFSDKNAATGKTVNVSGALSGADAGNYTLTHNTTTQADIQARAIAANITADDKTYDSTIAAVTSGALSGVLGADDVTLATSGHFSDKNAAAGKTVSVSGTLDGADAGNYTLTYNTTTQADILARTIAVNIAADDKIYDGTIAAVTSGALSGVLGADDVTLATSGHFGDKNAAAGKTVSVSGTLSGVDAGNYTLTYNTTTQADIQARTITASITADDKTYDGVVAAITNGTLSGVIGGDDVTLATSGSFNDPNAGIGKTVTVTGSISGVDANNYVLTSNTAVLADIVPKSLLVTVNDVTRVYDGRTWTGGNAVSYDGFISGEDASVLGGQLTWGGSAQGARDAGNYSLSASGLSSANYAINYQDGALTIDPRSITVTAAGGRSTYGDSSLVDPGLAAIGLADGEDVNVLTGLANSFDINGTTNAGTHVLSVAGTLTNGNYVVSQRIDGTWVVDPKTITVTANGGRSTYGESGLIAPGFSATGLVNGEDVSVLTGLANSFGIGNTISAGSHVLSVTGILTNGNYIVTERHDGSWVVDPARLVVTANDARKVPDGAAFQGGNGVSYQGFVNGEDASTLEGELVYGGSSQGAISPGRYVIRAAGLAASNYEIEYRDGSLIIDAPRSVPGAGEFERITRNSVDNALAVPGPWSTAGLPLRVAADYIYMEP